MFMTMLKRTLSLLVCIVLVAAVALFTIGCEDNNDASSPDESVSAASQSESGTTSDEASDDNVLGEGENYFTFKVVDPDGNESVFEIKTDKEKVGDALTELELISGEQGAYGLYVKTVNGITVDYDKDGKYWAFYVNGEYGMTGVDMTDIENGATYSFKAE
jgi:hypothetical protein